jgi:hypothetical protein
MCDDVCVGGSLCGVQGCRTKGLVTAAAEHSLGFNWETGTKSTSALLQSLHSATMTTIAGTVAGEVASLVQSNCCTASVAVHQVAGHQGSAERFRLGCDVICLDDMKPLQ